MNKLNNLKIGAKLTGGFLLITAIFIAFIVYIFFQLQRLGELQDEGARRASGSRQAEQTREDSLKLYQIIANTIGHKLR